jgi:hypothetical protein
MQKRGSRKASVPQCWEARATGSQSPPSADAFVLCFVSRVADNLRAVRVLVVVLFSGSFYFGG